MGDITTAYANTMLDTMVNGTYIALLTAITDAKAGTITEYTTSNYPNYARMQPSWAAAANEEKAPSADVLGTVTTQAVPDCVGFALYSAASGGTLKFVKAFDPIDVANCTTTNGSAVVTTTGNFNTAGVKVDQKVTGTGIPAGTYVQSVDSDTQITLSQNATADGTVTLTLGAAIRINANEQPKFTTSALKVTLT